MFVEKHMFPEFLIFQINMFEAVINDYA